MAFRAVHEQWGMVFAHLPDLGCGRSWEDVHRVRPVAPLRCDECRHPVHAKVSPAGLHFFAHAPGAPQCASAGESMAHHLLKLELSTAAREAGAHVELEVRGPEGAWRADVMATDPGGQWRIALEAQLSPITREEIRARAARMLQDKVRSVWFSDRLRPPWLGVVPSARLEPADGGGLDVAEGLMKFTAGRWEAGPRVPLAHFLHWVFAGRIVPHPRQRPTSYPLQELDTVFTAPHYARQERADLAQQARRQAQEARRERERQQHEAAIRALLDRQEALLKSAVEFVHRETGDHPYATEGTPQFAMGVPVYARGEPYAVICPVASRIPPLRQHLARLVLLVASEPERHRIAAQAAPGQRIVVLKPTKTAAAPAPRQPHTDALTVHQAVARMLGLDRM